MSTTSSTWVNVGCKDSTLMNLMQSNLS